MAKDPAFLFYSADFLVGIAFMSYEQIGKYIKLLCFQHQHGKLTKEQVLRVIGTWDEMIMEKFVCENGCYFNSRLEFEATKRKIYCESRRQSRQKGYEDTVRIYLIKDNGSGLIKIGSSVNPLRRFSEMCNQKSPAITVGNRDYSLIFTSRIIKRSEEGSLHEKYSDKRVTGEWFKLNKDDINYVRITYGETYVRRTENENTNENINENEDKKEIKINECSPAFENFWKLYPSRNGKKLLKKDALKQFAKLDEATYPEILEAVRNYAKSGQMPRDALRFLKDEYWREWIEPVPTAEKFSVKTEMPDRTTQPRWDYPPEVQELVKKAIPKGSK